MFLTSSQEVDFEFYKKFLKHCNYLPLKYSEKQHPFLSLSVNGKNVNFLVRHFRRGGEFRESEEKIYYPVIVIQNEAPILDKERSKNNSEVQGNFREENGENVGDVLATSTPLLHKYQVSVVAKLQSEINVVRDWFYEVFDIDRYEAYFIFKNDIRVKYFAEITHTNTENRFEFACDFSLKPFVQLKKDKTQEVGDIKIKLNKEILLWK